MGEKNHYTRSMVVQGYIPGTSEAEAEGWRGAGQPEHIAWAYLKNQRQREQKEKHHLSLWGPTRLTGCVRVLTFTLDCGKNAGQCECQRAKVDGLVWVLCFLNEQLKKKKKSLEQS